MVDVEHLHESIIQHTRKRTLIIMPLMAHLMAHPSHLIFYRLIGCCMSISLTRRGIHMIPASSMKNRMTSLHRSLYTKAASPSYFFTSAGCFVARNLTSSVSFSRVASLSWPEGLSAMTSARMGRRVGVKDIIVGLDSWSNLYVSSCFVERSLRVSYRA